MSVEPTVDEEIIIFEPDELEPTMKKRISVTLLESSEEC